MAFDRWNWLEQLKPQPPIVAAVEFLAERVAEALMSWPPDVVETEGPSFRRFAELLEPGSPRPALAAYREAIKRVRWELARDFDAIDHYERNHHLKRACPDLRNQIASEFIQHYILESFFSLMERTENRVKRGDVRGGIDLLERRIERAWASN